MPARLHFTAEHLAYGRNVFVSDTPERAVRAIEDAKEQGATFAQFTKNNEPIFIDTSTINIVTAR